MLANGWGSNLYAQSSDGPLATTPEACYNAALAGGWSVYGLTDGFRCWLGTDLYGAMAGGNSVDCYNSCAGAYTWNYCGSSTSVLIYSVQGESCGGCVHTCVYTVVYTLFYDAKSMWKWHMHTK